MSSSLQGLAQDVGFIRALGAEVSDEKENLDDLNQVKLGDSLITKLLNVLSNSQVESIDLYFTVVYLINRMPTRIKQLRRLII